MYTNQQLVEDMQQQGALNSKHIAQAMLRVDRADFVSTDEEYVYADRPLPIGHGQTISQPSTVAFMLQQLDPQAGEKILDVGCGSGWQTGLLAELVGEAGQVIGIELRSELIERAKQNLSKYDFKNWQIVQGDGHAGYQQQAPYDKIIIAAAAKERPSELLRQLKIGGRAVYPQGKQTQDIVVLDKIDETQFKQQRFPGFVFVPFVNSSI